jgi:beta-N-acetylhexosaminidase
MKYIRFLLLICSISIFCELSAQPDFLQNYNREWVDNVFRSLSTEEKIGQLLMPRANLSGKGYDRNKLITWIKRYKIGGLVFFAGNPTEQAIITNELQSYSKTPLFIGEDFEWGLSMRLDSTDRFPYQMTLGAMNGNDSLIEAMGAEIGRQCRAMGVHINYAPVVDVNNNPKNPVINFRSFGENKQNVTTKSAAYMKGLQSQRVIATAKHFPGHGDTDVDSHHDLPVIRHSMERLDETELFPFKYLIRNGLAGLMTAHIQIPSLDSTPNLAATLSKPIITDLLRKRLGYEGLVMSDAMDMKGVVKHFPGNEAIILALIAGNDLIETFEDVPGAVSAIQDAIRSGRISMADIDDKVKRILKAKAWVGLDKYVPVEISSLKKKLNTPHSDLLNRKMAEQSITLLFNKNEILPIRDLTRSIAVLSVHTDTETAFQSMTRMYLDADYFLIPQNVTDSILMRTAHAMTQYDVQLITLHLPNNRPSAGYSVNAANSKAISVLLEQCPNAIVCIFGNAFALDKLPIVTKAQALVLAYQDSHYLQEAAAMAVFGAVPFNGALPVTVNADYTAGMGMKTSALGRLAYGVPDMEGIDGKLLMNGVDSVIISGLSAEAYPGAVMLIARNGRVVYHKAYGYHTYEDYPDTIEQAEKFIHYANDAANVMDADPAFQHGEKLKAKNEKVLKGSMQRDDIFDLASVTKIAATALALMQWTATGRMNPDNRWSEVLPSLLQTNKADLTFRDMLTHRSGLQAWIPFWKLAVDSISTLENAILQDPLLSDDCIYQLKKPGFIKRLFGKKSSMVLDVAATYNQNSAAWDRIVKPHTIIWKKNTFSTRSDGDYTIKITDSLWMSEDFQNRFWDAIKISPLNDKGRYVYSDLHYYFYPAIARHLTGTDWKNFLYQTYGALGASSLRYNPVDKYPLQRIVPTEYDSIFRKGLLHGTVHDEGAAMMAGISGHAGLFGTANDLAKIMQLYLQNGYYGGIRFIRPEIVDEFTSYQYQEEGNRRGLAFDKPALDGKTQNAPSLASPASYGHSGYTGTYAWADPKYNLQYVLLTNRVYPSRKNNKISEMNIRTAVGDAIYKALIQD